MRKLVIIDGKSVFYRGYYAMGNLAMSDGTPTGGVYGFAVIAMEIVREIKPDKVVVAWDKAKTSIRKRKEIFSDYKAGRVKPPEDFFAQIPYLRTLIKELGWGFLECDDYEADDIIGTLSRQADEEGDFETVIVSSDLDMLQIVDENTKMYRLLKGFSKLEEMDVPAVEEKYGIKKRQFLDLKALKGDASDNIPGVPGIGEKTAVKLLSEYGDLEGVFLALEKGEIKGAVAGKLSEGKESAVMSKKLATIMTDAPVSLDKDVPEFKVDGERIIAALKGLEFNSLVRKFSKELGAGEGGQSLSPDTPRPTASGRSGGSPVTTGRAERSEESALPPSPNLVTNEDLLVVKDMKKKMHEEPFLAKEVLAGKKFWDLNQAKFLLNPLERKTADDSGATQVAFSFGETEEEKKENQQEFLRQQKEFADNPKLLRILLDYDLPLIPVLYKMETKGAKIDKEYFKKLEAEYKQKAEEIERTIFEMAGKEFNLNSPVQLSEVLFEKLQLPTTGIKKTQRGYSTGASELNKLKNEHAIIPKIMEYREVAKLLSTYILPLPGLADKNGRIHTTFTQDVTATGRLSSVNPNLQNIPVRSEGGKRIRDGFVADEGKVLVSADYSQFELRLAAVLAGDMALINDFNSGVDVHTKTAADVFGVEMDLVTKNQRRAAKVINFGVLYGMSARGLAEAAGMKFYEAKKFIEDYFEVRKPIRKYLDNVLRQARTEGYVETYYGRRRPTPDVKSANFAVRQAAERAAMNMPIQGTEADLMKRAMIKVDGKLKELGEGVELILQIHDSLVVECDEGKAEEVGRILKETMEGIAPELKIKLAVEVTKGKSWGEL